MAILLYGSRGDIQPGLCLALELQDRGDRVSVAVPPNLVSMALAVGVDDVRPLGMDSDSAWTSEHALSQQRSRNPLRRMRLAIANVRAGFRAMDDALIEAFVVDGAPLAGADVVVVAPLCQDRGLALAQVLDIPLVTLRFGPMSENGVVGSIPGVGQTWSAAWRRRSWRLADRVTWWATGWNENRFRRRVGLTSARGPLPARLRRLGIAQIQAYDPALFPGLADEWGDDRPLVGFLDLPAHARARIDGGDADPADASLWRWLDAGPPPLFVTFGSMPLPDRDTVMATIEGAADRVGLRCLFVMSGEREPWDDRSAQRSHVVSAVNHAAVLPRCAAAVHHGGAGTTAAVLRAGLPAVVCAVTADQPVWGDRLRALGVGDWCRTSALTTDGVTTALTTAVASRAAAGSLSARMVDAESAVAAAADRVQRCFASAAHL